VWPSGPADDLEPDACVPSYREASAFAMEAVDARMAAFGPNRAIRRMPKMAKRAIKSFRGCLSSIVPPSHPLPPKLGLHPQKSSYAPLRRLSGVGRDMAISNYSPRSHRVGGVSGGEVMDNANESEKASTWLDGSKERPAMARRIQRELRVMHQNANVWTLKKLPARPRSHGAIAQGGS